ncbi:MAG: hypothetical protein JWP08_1311 [Bryobacterales bacterium]|nr:hypothetical protein [Bryobacterales bacterium]
MNSKLRLGFVACLLVLSYAIFYPRHIELGGDQNSAVIAAQSLLEDGTYRVPLHEAYGPESSVEVGADMRQTLKWYPPGYTLVLYGLAKLGLTLAAGALVVFYVTKFVWTVAWLAAGRAWRIPDTILICAVAFSLFLAYPTTGTDVYESTGIAAVFLVLSGRLREPAGAVLVSATIFVMTLFRYSGVKLLGFYGLVELLRRPRPITFAKVLLTAVAPVGVYLFCLRVVAGDSTPYHGVGPVPHTRWILLPKGFYYAVTGAWSPTLLPLKALEVVLLLLAVSGLVLVWRNGKVEHWILLVLGYQAYCLGCLILVQISFGSMYPSFQPAFVTPRYLALAQPFSVAALLSLAFFALRPLHPVLRALPALILLATAINWMVMNRWIMGRMGEGPDGFMRFGDVDEIHRMLRAAQVDGVFDGTGVIMYTSVDPRRIYPDDIRSLHSTNSTRIAIVRYSGNHNELLEDLGKNQVMPYFSKRVGPYDVFFLTLPAGFGLTVNSHRGFVPHV